MGDSRIRGAWTVAVAVAAATACGPKDGRGSADPSDASGASGESGEPSVTQKVVYEKMPDGSVKKTTITTRPNNIAL